MRLAHPIAGVTPPLPARSGLLAGLTPEQARAVTHGTGPLLLLAGPGAGKTKTLTHRIAHLLENGQARPGEILAVTFSVRAAGELRLRLADLLGQERARGVTAATFHAFCARLLRQYAHLFGRSSRYTIYDQGDTRRVIEEILADPKSLAVRQALKAYGQPSSAELQALLSLAKSRLEDPDRCADAGEPADRLVATVWRESELELRRSNAFDFEDLIWFSVRLLREHRLRARWIRRRFRYVLVDEYQDINDSQAELVWLLAGSDGNLMVVADDDQLVHRWRGADTAHIVNFSERYPRHETIVLSKSFRSRAEILDAATSCVRHNPRRHAKQLVAVRGRGGRVSVKAFQDDWQEAHLIAGQIAEAITRGVPGPEILILARTSYATQPVQAALARAGIAHRVLGSLGLFERSEVKDALAYLTLLANPADAQAFRRAICAPRRGIGPATANALVTRARDELGGDLIVACARAASFAGIRSQTARENLQEFGGALLAVRGEMRAGRSLGHLVVRVLTVGGGLVEHFERRRDSSPSASRRRDAERVLEDLRSLCRAAQAFEEQRGVRAPVGEFLEYAIGLHAIEVTGHDRRVTVSTIHRAKGAEATLVLLLGCEEQLLPCWQSLQDCDPEALCEERRLFYVAATRAKDMLILTHARVRSGRETGGPSRFLAEAALLGEPAVAA